MTAMRIHRNAPIDQPMYFLDRRGDAITLDPAAAYKCSLKVRKTDDTPALTFVSGGGSGVGNIELTTDTIEDVLRDLLVFTAERALAEALLPGLYFCDLLRTDDPSWEIEFIAQVFEGVTPP